MLNVNGLDLVNPKLSTWEPPLRIETPRILVLVGLNRRSLELALDLSLDLSEEKLPE